MLCRYRSKYLSFFFPYLLLRPRMQKLPWLTVFFLSVIRFSFPFRLAICLFDRRRGVEAVLRSHRKTNPCSNFVVQWNSVSAVQHITLTVLLMEELVSHYREYEEVPSRVPLCLDEYEYLLRHLGFFPTFLEHFIQTRGCIHS